MLHLTAINLPWHKFLGTASAQAFSVKKQQDARTAHKRNPVTSYFRLLGKQKNSRRAKFKNKKQETKPKDKEKNCFFEKFINFSSVRLLHWGVFCFHQRCKWCVEFVRR